MWVGVHGSEWVSCILCVIASYVVSTALPGILIDVIVMDQAY